MSDCGILYVALCERARQAVIQSYASVLATGVSVPAVVWGSMPVSGMEYIPWRGRPPFNQHGVFLPGLMIRHYTEATPFERTLYMDADTTALRDIRPVFDFLDEYDFGIARHYGNKTLRDLPESFERNATMELLGKDAPLINGGVTLFRKNAVVEDFFTTCALEWESYRIPEGAYEWDNQPAMLRAIHNSPGLRVVYLEEKWNQKYRQEDTVIWHQMGQEIAGKRWR